VITGRAGDDEAQELPRKRGASRLPPPPEPPDPALTDPRRPVRVARFVSVALLVLCLVGSVQVVALVGIEAQRLLHTEREIARLERELVELRAETDDLGEIAQRGDDARYRELLARRQGYLFPHETRFVGPRAAP
jgi:hypothetical protein